MAYLRMLRVTILIVCPAFLIMFGAIDARAQETTKLSGKFTAAYTERHDIPVGDVQGHIVSLAQSQGTNESMGSQEFMNGAAVLNISCNDMVMGSGSHNGYIRFAMGPDTTFAKWEGKIATTQKPDGSAVTNFDGTFSFIKGTGKYKNISGKGTFEGMFVSEKEYSVNWQGEYFIKK